MKNNLILKKNYKRKFIYSSNEMKNIKRELISNDFRYSWQNDQYNAPIDSNGVQTSKSNLIEKNFSLLI